LSCLSSLQVDAGDRNPTVIGNNANHDGVGMVDMINEPSDGVWAPVGQTTLM
jgi:hypothetical protein